MSKLKIALTSDLHGFLPDIPECDLCIIAGDVCPDQFPGNRGVFPDPEGQAKWLDNKLKSWWTNIPSKETVATWGNHDFVGERYPNANFTVDSIVNTACGNVWLTPWSNRFGPWAFMQLQADLQDTYAKIPEGIDILVSHQPPYGYGDIAPNGEHVGSKQLLEAIDRVKPKIVVCGHIHGLQPQFGYGKYYHDLDDTSVVIYNVAHVNEYYEPINPVVIVDWECEENVNSHTKD